MLSHLSLKLKLIIGSFAPLLLVIAVGIISYNSINSLLESNRWVDHTNNVIRDAMDITASAVDMETGMRGYLLAGQEQFLDPYTGGYSRFGDQVADLKNTVSDNPAQVQLLNEIEDNINAWVNDVTEPQIQLRREIGNGKAMQDIAALVAEARGKAYFDRFRGQIDLFKQREQSLMDERKTDLVGAETIEEYRTAMEWINHTHLVIREALGILSTAVDMETGMRGYLLAGQEAFLDPYNNGYRSFVEKTESLMATVSDNPAQVRLLREMQDTIGSWRSNVTEPQIALRREIGDSRSMQDIAALVGEARGKKYFDGFRDQVGTFIDRERVLMEQRKEEAAAVAAQTKQVIFWGILITVFASLIIALLLSKSIVTRFQELFRGLKSFSNDELSKLGERFGEIVERLRSGSSQVSSASSQVSESAQQLASGSSQQAASLEEVSATLEELSTLAEQNSENAKEANTLSGKAATAAHDGKSAMNQMAEAIKGLTLAVNRIKDSSEKTSKILKTIDDIAFQTNLLALNAAVEAARAGDAGKGFSVVAEEVRSLAGRSASASKDTAILIEESLRNADEGVTATETVATSLNKIIEENIELIVREISSVQELNSGVASASNEQSTGIQQVAQTIEQMNEITQGNAANAEESSAASEELSAQSVEMNELVESLVEVTKGTSGHNRPPMSSAPSGPTSPSVRKIKSTSEGSFALPS